MKDPISISRVNSLHPKARASFQNFIEHCEGNLSTTEVDIVIRIEANPFRSIDEQNHNYAQGRTQDQLNKVGLNNVVANPSGKIITWAIGGHSWHNYGLAVDLVIMENGTINWEYDYSKLAALMPEGMKWGGNFPENQKDWDHFEITFGLTTWSLLAKYNSGLITNGYVNI